ncbi:MAG: LysM peptidoglycan-binding domain-containing protein [Verrucomicrobiota bacterium]|nr:LysM peptidoglycan-binding domain-containing protein [Verrucomicrobiota bacterium]
MKWLFALILACGIFGGAYYFASRVLFKQEIAVRQEKRSDFVPEPTPDASLPEFEAVAQIRQQGDLNATREALISFIQKFPGSSRVEDARTMLGEVNTDILLNPVPSPDKQEYTVRSGDVLAKIANKMKSTPELIMRTNNLTGTMLHIGDKLYIAHPDFSLFIQTNAKAVVLANHSQFFKRYYIREVKLPPKPAARITTKVAEVMAWKQGKRIGFGTKEYANSTRWVRLAAPGFTLYAMPDSSHPDVDEPPPPTGLGLAASDLQELSSLVNGKTPATITE